MAGQLDRTGSRISGAPRIGRCHDGDPSGGLTWGRDGNLYGVTRYGGTFDWATIFRITPTGQMTIIYNFTGGPDGGAPITGLTLGSNGDFYGTTSEGGGAFSGTVFRFKPPPVDCREQ